MLINRTAPWRIYLRVADHIFLLVYSTAGILKLKHKKEYLLVQAKVFRNSSTLLIMESD